ncbi:uncharacterized protein LOC126802181 isoform X1 [Argentina anserina]|uniref:uncharacterized protein LOC126802181 isoform X1 n=2 Tax=Argentina anserina TaxID=57926 RepID=UPI0021767E51|nr:uncharacterized protein LOC126802181 isoform X1 [Potentilla anserina]XP_050385715.1 uncharacterized protein LOC126802181 isoform X1 [Potentilla anserina]XP_050385717.1 uncharacterized protein LOC126802181 isoform X1 [Potentilla anserina]
MSSVYSPGRSPGSSRLQVGGGGGVSRLRSSSMKKPPEPLRRSVADCLASSAASSHHATTSSSVLLSEASRILRDYLASPTTMDLSYSVILEHTIAERERSPAVVARCVALLKRYLLRYKPSEETLLQIDRFCVNTIAECDMGPNRKLTPWSQSLASTASTNIPPLSVPSFASGTLVKSLNYVRSLVSQHLPRRSFHPGAFSGGLSATRQSLPSLSSLLSRSFNGQLSPAHSGESSENKDVTPMSILNLSNTEKVDGMKDLEYLALDVLRWRWLGEQQSSLLLLESDRVANSQEMRTYNLLEVGAAALLVGDVKAKMKGQPWKFFGTADMPYLDQLLQPSPVTAITDSSAARAHLRAITACKRTKSGPSQIWDESPASTFRPRAKPLFQYRHYSEQQPLRLNPAEVCEVIAAVCSEASSPTANLMTVSSRLNNNYGKPSMDAAVSVLIKLVIDMYVLDPGTAAPLTLSMLQEMLNSPIATCRVRAFDFILNLGVHAHLLEPMMTDDTSTIEEDYSQESYFDSEAKLATQEMRRSDSVFAGTFSAIDDFETWILNILYEILLLLVQIEEKEESVWASALSCLLYFVCDRGKILRNRINGLDIRVVKALLVSSRKNSWAEVVHCKLISMLANMFYQVPQDADENVSSTRLFVVEQVDLIGGLEFIFLEYSLAKSKDERRNLFLVLFDYVLHQINEACIATGGTEYSDDEIQPLVALLTMADASEAIYICIKLGLIGIGELMKNSISDALSRYPNSERLNLLLENVMEKFGATISSFTHLDTEFFHMMQITKSYKSLDSIEGAVLRNGVGMKAKLSWAVLHSLLHSGNIAYHRNAYVWLSDLLIAEISDERDSSIWSNIKTMQQKIFLAGVHDSAVASDVPVPIWLMCGLLKSRHSSIRWGFLFVLERLLMRCKILLNETKTQQSHDSDIGDMHKDNRLEKANAVIDIMSSALSLVFQINETDRMNILKMCDILFSQLCLKVPPASSTEVGEDAQRGRVLFRMDGNKKVDDKENYQDVCTEGTGGRSSQGNNNPLEHGTELMAALLLRGQAIVPMQLVTRVPAALLYWPLIQLAGAATDNIALGIAVGSKGRGNLPGATSDIRATLLLLLIGKCTADPTAFQEVGGEEFFRELLDDTDSRVAYYSSAFLLKRMMTEKPEKYQHMLQNLVVRAQQSNNEKLLENPYLQMRGILQLANDLGTGL